jgi:FkbH-like protein
MTDDTFANPPISAIASFHAEYERQSQVHESRRPHVGIKLLAECTVAGIVEPLRYFCRQGGLEPDIAQLPAYQIEPWLMTGHDGAEQSAGATLVVISDFEKLVGHRAVEPSSEQRAGFFARLQTRLELCEKHRTEKGMHVIVSSLFGLLPALNDAYAHVGCFGQTSFLLDANAWLLAECRARQLEVLPLHDILGRWGYERCVSLKHYLSDDSPFSPEGANRVAHALWRQMAAARLPRKKALVVDLDGTLWQGVLGECGPSGVVYRPDCYAGRVYWQILAQLKALAASGIILAINSKNQREDVMAILHDPEFPLVEEDFAAIRANWLPKDENLRSIAAELGLGMDRIVMLDDSAAECLFVRQTCPDVEVVQVPERLSEYPMRLTAITGFDRPRLTDADMIRRVEYQNANRRRDLASTTSTLAEFLNALQIRLTLRHASESERGRLSQLFERTTQFNMTGRRFSENDLAVLQDNGTAVVRVAYDDCFGSSGVIGAIVAEHRAGTVRVMNFVLSCRVLGRCVEHAIIGSVASVWSESPPTHVEFLFEPTTRNAPAARFLEEIGWVGGEPLPLAAIPSPAAIAVRIES